jgi:hypothetical protein
MPNGKRVACSVSADQGDSYGDGSGDWDWDWDWDGVSVESRDRTVGIGAVEVDDDDRGIIARPFGTTWNGSPGRSACLALDPRWKSRSRRSL